MKRIFLGKPLHWLLLLAVVVLGWLAGRIRLHVTDFNLFALALLALTAVLLLAVLASSKPGETVTREPIEPPEAE